MVRVAPRGEIQESDSSECNSDAKKIESSAPVGQMSYGVEQILRANPSLPSSAQIAIRKAFAFYQNNLKLIKNRRYLTVNDFMQNASQNRQYVLDLETGRITAKSVAQGRGSDSGRGGPTGIFRCHGNAPGKFQTPGGFLLTGRNYKGKHGESLRLLGLEPHNAATCDRAVVVHQASYIGGSQKGRSLGCPAIAKSKDSAFWIRELSGGSLIYNHTGDKPKCT